MNEVTLSVEKKEAIKAFSRRDLIRATPSDDLASNDLEVAVKYSPGSRIIVEWDVQAGLAKSDEGDVEDFLEALEKARGAAESVASAVGMPTPQAGLEVANRTLGVARAIKELFSSDRTVVPLTVEDLPVIIKNRKGRTVELKGSLQIEASWMTDEPGDVPWDSVIGDGNFAWFEVETFNLTVDHQCAASGAFDVTAPWGNDTTKQAYQDLPIAKQAVNGRSFMFPASETDFVGAFPKFLQTCSAACNEDETEVDFTISMTALADDELLVHLASIRLILEVIQPTSEPGGAEPEAVEPGDDEANSSAHPEEDG